MFLKLQPDDVGALNNLAWILATSHDATIRNGAKALEFANRACRDAKRPELLSTLAAAQAETGDFASAVATVQTALKSASADLQRELAPQLRAYQQGQPWRDPPPTR